MKSATNHYSTQMKFLEKNAEDSTKPIFQQLFVQKANRDRYYRLHDLFIQLYVTANVYVYYHL